MTDNENIESIDEAPPADEATQAEENLEESQAEPEPEAPESEPAPEPEEPLQTQYVRLQADFDNFRKRIQREKANWTRQAQESFFAELLPVLDHFDMGLQTAEQHDVESSVIEGFRLVSDQLLALLAKSGLEPIEAEGQPFDPHLHEAVTHIPSDEVEADIVISQSRRGFKLGDQLLRPAPVVVSSGPAEKTETE